MMKFKNEIGKSAVDDNLKFITLIEDCCHVGKSLKASFANWCLTLNNERANLGLLFTLRNRSEKETKNQMQTLVPKNDHVKNKCRKYHMGVFCVTRKPLANYLDGAGHVVHTIIPEKNRFADNHKVG